MTQGARNNANFIDLDAALSARLLQPKPLVLQGYTYNVRTDLTSVEVAEYIKLSGQNEDVKALTMLVGARDAKKLNAALDKLPQTHAVFVAKELHIAAGIIQGVSEAESAGE